MDVNPKVELKFARVDVNFQMVTVSLFRNTFLFFFFFFCFHMIKHLGLIILHIQFQPNALSNSGENVDFSVLVFW